MFNYFKKVIFYLVLFLLPSQFAKHYWPDYSFIYGSRIDYLSPAIYLVNLLILFLNGDLFYFVWTLFFIPNLFFSINLLNSLFFILNFSVIASLYFLLKKYWQKQMVKILVVSFIFVIIVGFLQFVTGKTLGGLLYYFGERHFNINTPGIALFSFFGYEKLRAYSIFSHPNSFVSYVVVLGLCLIPLVKQKFLIIIGIITSLIITASTSAYIGLLVGLVVGGLAGKRMLKLFILGIFVASLLFMNLKTDSLNQSFAYRVESYNTVKQIIKENFWFGVGFNNYLLKYKGMARDLRYIQPVHNVYLLVFAESGLVGFLILYFLLSKFSDVVCKSNFWLKVAYIYILITASFDHYWWTLNQNKLILVLFVYFVFANLSKVNQDEYL